MAKLPSDISRQTRLAVERYNELFRNDHADMVRRSLMASPSTAVAEQLSLSTKGIIETAASMNAASSKVASELTRSANEALRSVSSLNALSDAMRNASVAAWQFPEIGQSVAEALKAVNSLNGLARVAYTPSVAAAGLADLDPLPRALSELAVGVGVQLGNRKPCPHLQWEIHSPQHVVVPHGLAGIDRKAAKTTGNARNKMQHGKSGPGRTIFEKISIFQRI